MDIPLTGTLRRLAAEVLEAASGSGGARQLDQETQEQSRLRSAVWRLRQAYTEASDGGALDELIVVLTRDLRDGREALLAWLNLLEEIVQLTEVRFGSQKGQGDFKAMQAKAAVRRLLQHRTDARSAIIVDFVGPFVIDRVTGWFIDLTVAVLNSRGEALWMSAPIAVRVPLRTRVVTRLIQWFSRVLDVLNPPPALDRTLYDEVDRIAGGPGNPFVAADRLLELAEWVAQHRRQALALVDLISGACDEVELVLGLPSAAKHDYARNLIIATLEDAGLEPGALELELTEAVIDVMIKFVVDTNNKRGRYTHLTA
jgi:hypothetical protein